MLFKEKNNIGIGCIVITTKKIASSFKSTLDMTCDIITVTDSEIIDHYNYVSSSVFFNCSRSILSLHNHSFFHIITSSDVLNKLRIHFSHLTYYQHYIGIHNPFILSDTTKGHKNVQFILHSIEICLFHKHNSLENAVNSGKLVLSILSLFTSMERIILS